MPLCIPFSFPPPPPPHPALPPQRKPHSLTASSATALKACPGEDVLLTIAAPDTPHRPLPTPTESPMPLLLATPLLLPPGVYFVVFILL